MSLEAFLKSFITLFVIMDPFASLPVFLSVTRRFSKIEKSKSADKAALVAGSLILVFLFLGPMILSVLGITLSSLQIAGGIILAILGLRLVLFSDDPEKHALDVGVAGVIIGTPLITGPGVITAIMLFVNQYGVLIPLFSSMLSLFLIWVLLKKAEIVQSILGDTFIQVLSRIMGILLVAISVEFVRKGIGF